MKSRLKVVWVIGAAGARRIPAYNKPGVEEVILRVLTEPDLERPGCMQVAVETDQHYHYFSGVLKVAVNVKEQSR